MNDPHSNNSSSSNWRWSAGNWLGLHQPPSTGRTWNELAIPRRRPITAQTTWQDPALHCSCTK